MRDYEALRLALYLYHLPSAVRSARGRQLPAGIPSLLEVAADESDTAKAAAAQLDRPVDVVRQAAAFFIEQILLAQDADAYRVLGAGRDSTDADLRRNMALLQRWVHPDMDRAGDRSVYAARVTQAWEALKTPERRAAHDAAHPPEPGKSKRRARQRSRSHRGTAPGGSTDRPGVLRAALRYLLGSRKPQ